MDLSERLDKDYMFGSPEFDSAHEAFAHAKYHD